MSKEKLSISQGESQSYKLNPNEVEKEYENVSIEHESDKADCHNALGWFGASLKNNVTDVVDDFKEDPLGGALALASPSGQITKMGLDIGKRIEQNIKEAEEEADAEKQKEDQKKAEEAEKRRLEELKSTYIVNGAMIQCSCSPNRSFLTIPISHGQYIKNIAQLNTKDNVLNTNVVSFKVCQSPLNPSVKDAAVAVLKEAQDRSKGFFDRFMDLFAKPKEIDKDNIDEELLKQCAGDCLYYSALEWLDGEETVTVDGTKSLLGRCNLTCIYGGEITFYTSGQEPKE